MKKILLFLLLVQYSMGFLTYLYTPPKQRYHSYEVINKPKNESTCIIFFGGGSNSISYRIYDSFLKKIQENKMSVYIPCFNYKHIPYLIHILQRQYKNVIMMGHSSGCSTLLNQCSEKSVKKVILLDPVKTNLGGGKKLYNIPFISSILIIQAMKAYKKTYNPPGIPFIPSFLRITPEDLSSMGDRNIQLIQKQNNGHSDILNPSFSNIMHNSRITVGDENRTNENLNLYHNTLAETFKEFSEN